MAATADPVAELRLALASPALDRDGPDGRHAALAVAVALGRCRLFGVAAAPAPDVALSPDRALAAAAGLAERSVAAPAAGLLLARLAAWAALVALDDAYEAALTTRAPQRGALGAALDAALDAVDALDAALEARAEPPTVAEETAAAAWRRRLTGDFAAAAPAWLGAPAVHRPERWWLPPPVPLAAAADDLGPPERPALRWRSPDGAWSARLARPMRPRDDDAPLPLAFTGADGAPALALAGQPVRLAAVPSVVGPDGTAPFTAGELRDGGPEPELFVGASPRLWPRVSEEA
jgi:hypothetical protein